MSLRLQDAFRGRARGRAARDYAVFNSMVSIASKYDLASEQLLDAFVEALQTGTSHCGGLTISCREVNRDTAIFLITKAEKVIWQSSVNLKLITHPTAKDSLKAIPLPKKVQKIVKPDRTRKISELRLNMKGVNVTAEIVDIPPAKEVLTRWGSTAFVSNLKVADETGSIRLSLWNNQIKMVNIGDEITLENCSVSRFAGELQLRLARKGTISILNQPQKDALT